MNWSGGTYPNPDDDGSYTCDHEWTFRGRTIEWTFDVPTSLYRYYANRERTWDYGMYVIDPFQESFFEELAERIDRHTDEFGLDRRGRFDFAVRFVQSFEYALDMTTVSRKAYPKFPVETLVHRRGDCEDGSILLSRLLSELGHDVVFLVMRNRQHMLIGVADDGLGLDGSYYDGDDRRYYPLETTDHGWDPGELPRSYMGAAAEIQETEGHPILVHRWDTTRNGSGVDVDLHVANFGDVSADRVTVNACIEDPDENVVHRQGLTRGPIEIPAGRTESVSESLRIGQRGELRCRIELGVNGLLHDTSTSGWS